MFLTLSKLLDVLLEPLAWALLLGGAGLALRRRARLARGLALAGLALLYVFALPPVAHLLMRAGEAGATSTWQPHVTYDAVILLGGGLDPDATERSGQAQYRDAAERALRTFELLRAGRARAVLVSAGSLDPRPRAVVEAQVLAEQLQGWGVAPERIVQEGRSRNTRENALESARVVRERGWRTLLLVTSALHLPRALECFRAVGLTPDTLAVDVRTGFPGRLPWSLLPRASALDASTDVLRELAGRRVYRLRGWARP